MSEFLGQSVHRRAGVLKRPDPLLLQRVGSVRVALRLVESACAFRPWTSNRTDSPGGKWRRLQVAAF